MKKLKKFGRFCAISAVVLVPVIFIFQIIFKLIWHFDILNKKAYRIMSEFWEQGGVYNSFSEWCFLLAFILMPVVWILLSRKIYKFGFWKLIFYPIVWTYHKITRPKNMEVEHVKIKNLGGKDKTLDEIISDKIKEQGQDKGSAHIVRDLRKQISLKIEENEKQ